jgi:hypothetical protein
VRIKEEKKFYPQIQGVTESHEAREEAKRAGEAAERARCIGILIVSLLQHFFWLQISKLLLL